MFFFFKESITYYPNVCRNLLKLSVEQNFLLYVNVVFIRAYIFVNFLRHFIPELGSRTLSICMIIWTSCTYRTGYDLLFSAMWLGASYILVNWWNIPLLLFALFTLSSFKNEMFEFFMDGNLLLSLVFLFAYPFKILEAFRTNFSLHWYLLVLYLTLQSVMLYLVNQPNHRCLSLQSTLLTSLMLTIYVDDPYNLYFYGAIYICCLLIFFMDALFIKLRDFSLHFAFKGMYSFSAM